MRLPDEKELYDRWKSQAKSIKTIGRMIVGAATIASVIAVVAIDATHVGSGLIGTQRLTADIFAVTATGLAIAAAFELVYTLYTPGPDEALNPLLLGLSWLFSFLPARAITLIGNSDLLLHL